MVFLRFLRQKTVVRVMRLSGSSPAGAAMVASSAPAQIQTGQSRDPERHEKGLGLHLSVRTHLEATIMLVVSGPGSAYERGVVRCL